ncbi:amidohydrolase family protein [Sphingomonas nostoxanthinifaciens]|uniref:amidohydrolase family protein n=1 Tax=Sphingomonas nostoxanthinifaciens TaxID=2872652 RepID=UPI001CC1C60C|nr:amidohydrolase family protein [Sphingomonas nostoxanthinifaciens]UAK22924.1 amidohydrolase family protein [Sphingomonas nostoxanthinifaciens]
MVRKKLLGLAAGAAMALVGASVSLAQQTVAPAAPSAAVKSPLKGSWGPAPARNSSESVGPFRKLVIRGATLIDGSGGPPMGPIDIVIEGNRIVAVNQAGWPGLPMKADREPRDADYEIDAHGMYVMPGFIDCHVHGAGTDKAPDLGYNYKLWLAHGVTTVRGVPLASPEMASSEKNRSARNEIAAPRIFNYQTLGAGWSGGTVDTVEKARAWVQWAAKNNIDGIKFFNRPNETPEITSAAIDEAHKHNMGTVAHLSQNGVANFNARQAGEAGLDTVTHFYGHFESLLKDATIQKFRSDYDYNNEQDRFGSVADLFDQSYEPGSPQWIAYLAEQKANHVNFDPTFNIYAASRDLMRARNADWHSVYTTPELWDYFQSTRDNHGSYFYDWTTDDEVRWKNFYKKFMTLINDYKNMGGHVTIGTDSGFIWKLYGFAYIEELELFREAGFTPLEVIRTATKNGAETLWSPKHEAPPVGIVRPGMLADLVIAPENPLANLKTLYGSGFLRLNPKTNKVERVGGVKYTIKDGIVYDAHRLLQEVAETVSSEKKRMGRPDGLPVQP